MSEPEFIVGYVDDMNGFSDEHYKNRKGEDIVINGDYGHTLDEVKSALKLQELVKERIKNIDDFAGQPYKLLQSLVEKSGK